MLLTVDTPHANEFIEHFFVDLEIAVKEELIYLKVSGDRKF